MTLDRKKLITLGVILFLLVAALFTAYYVQNFVTSTRGRAAAPLAANEVSPQNLSEESVVQREDDTVHISLYKEEGSLYETQGKQEAAAREFIAENPRFETEEEAKQQKSLPQLLGLAPRGEELLPENIVSESALVRSFEDEKDSYLARQGFQLEKDHYFYNQEINDIPVFGATLAVHVKNDNEIYAVDGNLTRRTDVPRQQISEDRAKQIALQEAQKEAANSSRLEIVGTKRYIFNKAVVGLSDDAKNYPSLAVKVRSLDPRQLFFTEYFVDLTSGTILFKESLIRDALDRKVHNLTNCANPYTPPLCPLLRGEGSSSSGDADGDSIYTTLGDVYNFFFANYQRDSYDNSGATLVSGVHFPDPSWWNCPNAWWDGSSMTFCDGLATRDIAGHELMHGVTEKTAGLIYSYQSGATNESLSDIFAYAVDPDWEIGEDIVNLSPYYFPIPLRYMDDPPKRNDPDRLFSSLYYCSSGDHGGVHTNSGVINKMFYLMTTGGNFNGCNLTGIGAQKAHAIIYRALTTYLTDSSNFKAMYTSVNRGCDDLYQPNSETCNNVRRAMQATEIDQQPDFIQTGAKCSGKTRQTPACVTSPTPTGQTTPTSIPANTPTPTPRPTSTPTPTPQPSPTPTPIPTTTPTPRPPPTNNRISWRTDRVTLEADNFYITVNGKHFLGNVANITVRSDPGSSTYTTLEATWQEHGVEMRMYMYFRADGTYWHATELRTYNGLGAPQSNWVYYDGFTGNVLGSPLTQSSFALTSRRSSTYTGSINFRNIRLQPFTNLVAPTPTVIPTPSPTPCPGKSSGNANGDCTIDVADFNIWRENFLEIASTRGGGWPADFNGDGTVDLVDFSIWRYYFNAKPPYTTPPPS